MATAPSDEEVLRAVERRVSRPGVTTRLTVPGAAALSWQSVFACRIVRSIERRVERGRRVKGRPSGLANRPTYTDLGAYPVKPPADPATPRRLELVREDSLAQEPCGDCVDGRKDCAACAGRGGRACPRHLECDACHGGPDACWECDGTGHPRTRRPRAARARPEDGRERAACKRCRRPDVACPKCLGERQITCTVCKGTGFAGCGACKGAKRLRHEECGGTGRFTVWTEGVVTHTPSVDEIPPVYPPFSKLKKGQWRTAELTGADAALPDFLEDVHLERAAPLLAVEEGEVARRVTLRHLPLARVELTSDPDRVYYAFPDLTGGIEVIGRPSRQRLTALAWAAFALAALAAVVTLTVLR
ncbi:hypothetical protein ACFY30_38080 [Streptomyces sp. NPDC000345]|uniref:hypothetical protein n=1 Tax=Streptomyces sp. NPDC000345 TaxID=3364537 RepID=UPI0036C64A84